MLCHVMRYQVKSSTLEKHYRNPSNQHLPALITHDSFVKHESSAAFTVDFADLYYNKNYNKQPLIHPSIDTSIQFNKQALSENDHGHETEKCIIPETREYIPLGVRPLQNAIQRLFHDARELEIIPRDILIDIMWEDYESAKRLRERDTLSGNLVGIIEMRLKNFADLGRKLFILAFPMGEDMDQLCVMVIQAKNNYEHIGVRNNKADEYDADIVKACTVINTDYPIRQICIAKGSSHSKYSTLKAQYRIGVRTACSTLLVNVEPTKDDQGQDIKATVVQRFLPHRETALYRFGTVVHMEISPYCIYEYAIVCDSGYVAIFDERKADSQNPSGILAEYELQQGGVSNRNSSKDFLSCIFGQTEKNLVIASARKIEYLDFNKSTVEHRVLFQLAQSDIIGIASPLHCSLNPFHYWIMTTDEIIALDMSGKIHIRCFHFLEYPSTAFIKCDKSTSKSGDGKYRLLISAPKSACIIIMEYTIMGDLEPSSLEDNAAHLILLKKTILPMERKHFLFGGKEEDLPVAGFTSIFSAPRAKLPRKRKKEVTEDALTILHFYKNGQVGAQFFMGENSALERTPARCLDLSNASIVLENHNNAKRDREKKSSARATYCDAKQLANDLVGKAVCDKIKQDITIDSKMVDSIVVKTLSAASPKMLFELLDSQELSQTNISSINRWIDQDSRLLRYSIPAPQHPSNQEHIISQKKDHKIIREEAKEGETNSRTTTGLSSWSKPAFRFGYLPILHNHDADAKLKYLSPANNIFNLTDHVETLAAAWPVGLPVDTESEFTPPRDTDFKKKRKPDLFPMHGYLPQHIQSTASTQPLPDLSSLLTIPTISPSENIIVNSIPTVQPLSSSQPTEKETIPSSYEPATQPVRGTFGARPSKIKKKKPRASGFK